MHVLTLKSGKIYTKKFKIIHLYALKIYAIKKMSLIDA